jgi:hypothetical protein
MADYSCWPLWESSPGHVGNIDPDSLPISNALKLRLAFWARAYDETLDMADPKSSGFETEEKASKFREEQRKLRDALRDELGPDFTIVIWPE